MLEQISDNADIIIAAVQTALTLDMLPTIWHQWRARASTVPLTSSVPTAVGLAVLALVFFSTGLYLATATVIVGSAMWSVVAGQRIGYNKKDGSTTSTPDADPELRLNDSRLSGPSPVDVRYTGGECGCVFNAWAGRCWCDHCVAGGSQGQETGVGLAGGSQGASTADKKISDLIQYTSATTHDCYGDRIKLEEACGNCGRVIKSFIRHEPCTSKGIKYCKVIR